MRTLICIIACLLPLVGAQAQEVLSVRSNTEGLHVGLRAGVANWSSKYFLNLDELEPLGVGLGLEAGYGFNQRYELFVRYDWNSFLRKEEWDRYALSTVGIGGRVNFGGTLQRLRPYVELGAHSASLVIDPVLLDNELYEYKLKGATFSVGGGLRFFLTPRLNLSLNATAGWGKFTSFQISGEGLEDRPDLRLLQGAVAVSYFFGGR